MPGKLCTGVTSNNIGAGRLRTSKAYCEGVHYRASGTAAEKPLSDNPHLPGSDAEFSWSLGWNSANSASGVSITLGCCSATAVIPA